MAVAECPADEWAGINEGCSPVVDGGVVGVEGRADEFGLFLGDEDRVGDVQERCERGSGCWIGARPQRCQIDG